MAQISQPAPMSVEDTLYEAAMVACLAPSVANSQPWRWRIRRDTLELRADRSRKLTVSDPDGRLMTISCGAALHHATVVLSVLGVEAVVERVADPPGTDLLARLTITGSHTVTAEDMKLHNAIRVRHTDRRPFTGTEPPGEALVERLRQAAGRFDVNAYAFPRSEVSFLSIAARGSARIEGGDPAYREEIAGWTTRRDPSAGHGVPPEVAVPQVKRTVPVRDYALGGTPGLDPGPGGDRYSTYLAFATVGDAPVDWLRTGEATSAVLLEATAAGLASSVMSDVVEVPGARVLLQALLPEGGIPQLTIRVGMNEGAPPVPQTPRRPSSEVIEVIQ